ncbi:type VII secretion-associated serine protease mycosin [Streptacidiphilus sp. ASG 303]|uniref:type VII secretion-associated serine protease mycosin n=1 Tax=Streptacidiphilus sp. ASG 303 TaxID=2896847 RepID=UPI001E59A6D8|nr:type VII secretion-associated serine protease mycosin [Streptacidiphilus sp. ASG 303]MCD0486187.1 type VII secretion-associated serine protease mycosin [Streptacidiphilus sp. ASG 303]
MRRGKQGEAGRARRALGGAARPAACAAAALGVLAGAAAAPAAAAGPAGGGDAQWSPLSPAAAGECTFPSGNVAAVPWSLQRVVLDQLWRNGITGKGVTVAVVDTGVDDANPQLRGGKVLPGEVLLTDPQTRKPATGGATLDPVGHGTKVAGIIAARRSPATGFVGLAPDARILPIRQNDSEGSGDVKTLTRAIQDAVKAHAQVINISQDVRAGTASGLFAGQAELHQAVRWAVSKGVVVVASSGNDGKDAPTYPAAFPEVIAVGASDRNNERASFSQYGPFVDVAAPGVDMLSTVPRGGQCTDNGTSFSAPYVAGVAALLKQKYPQWTPAQIAARIEQTAQRNRRDRDDFTGWGVVDPVKAVTSDAPPAAAAVPDPQTVLAARPVAAQPLTLGESRADRDRRTATYVLGAGLLGVLLLGGGSVVLRDHRRRRPTA